MEFITRVEMKGEKSIVTPGEGEVTNETYGFVSCNGKFS